MTRHIPEDELHAYLDQALSRSQCIEIERHLAECERCQAARDGVAALRDRTTALLSRVGPQLIAAPPFETLVRRGSAFAAARSRRRRMGLWAASVAGALATGFASHHFLIDAWTSVAAAPVRPATERVPVAVAPQASVPAAATAQPRKGAAPVAPSRATPATALAAQVVAPRAARAPQAVPARDPALQNRTLGAAGGAVNERLAPPALEVAAAPADTDSDAEPVAAMTQPAAVFMSVQRLEAGEAVNTVAMDLPSFQPAPPVRSSFEIPAFSRRGAGDDSVRSLLLRRLSQPIRKP